VIQFKPDIKYRLVDLRQDPHYGDLRSDLRRTIRYVEGLEREVLRLSGMLSKSSSNSAAK